MGYQIGGRFVLFLNTDVFWRDYLVKISKGEQFGRASIEERSGIFAVLVEVYGHLSDLLQTNSDHPMASRGQGKTGRCKSNFQMMKKSTK